MQLVNKQATVILQVRTEKHGAEVESASTLHISVETGNELLDELVPGMREAFYTHSGEPQEELDVPSGSLPVRRFPLLGTLPWGYEGDGYIVRIEAVRPRATIQLEDCELCKCKLELKEGGTVVLTFNVNCDPDGADVSKLYRINGHRATVTLAGPPEDPESEEGGSDGESESED